MPVLSPNTLIPAVCFGVFLLALVRILFRWIRTHFAPVQSVSAKVLEKQILHGFSKYSGTGERRTYQIVFLVEGRKKSFRVSKFSFDGYHPGEEGILTYQADRLISFR